MTPNSRAAQLPHLMGVYVGASGGWEGVNHVSPDVLAEARERGDGHGDDVGEGEDEDEVTATVRQRDVWKTLVRYVWHNAESIGEAVEFFGRAALTVDPGLERWMTKGEVAAVKQRRRGGRARDRERARGCGLGRWPGLAAGAKAAAVWRTLEGYTPLAALVRGEHDEWARHEGEQERRRQALRVVLMAAWKALPTSAKHAQTDRMERTLAGAFRNFTALTGEDRDLLAWVTQTAFGAAFGETRAATCARRKRKVRKTLEMAGMLGVTGPGGKSAEARRNYAAAARGNHNRAGEDEGPLADDLDGEEMEAREAMAWHEGVVVRPDLPKGAKERRAYLKGLADEAEERRLIRLDPRLAGMELARTVPGRESVSSKK